MANINVSHAKVIRFPQQPERSSKLRKSGRNTNKEGSVRNINGKVYVDFMYLDERVRESSNLVWDINNAKHVREQLDKIIVSIKAGTFRFAQVFPKSKKADYFTEKEQALHGGNKTPDQVLFKDYALLWYDLKKDSERVSPRTLWGYKSHIDRYLIPYFGKMTFADLTKGVFDRFVSWAKKQQFRKKRISNETVNKIFVPLKMICMDATIEHGWGSTYNPLFGFKKLPEGDAYENIYPFSLEEQGKIIAALPDHWKPYFDVAFKIGFRQGEQIAIQPDDIDWSMGLLHIRRAFTRDDRGKTMLGKTKNKYSRRTIKLIPVMFESLKAQKEVYDQCQGEYFFSSKQGKKVDRSHLRQRIWTPALKKAGVQYREIKQTRHSFATNALSCGENPLWIAKVMGHRDTDMIIKVYSKYIEDARGSKDGSNLNAIYEGMTS